MCILAFITRYCERFPFILISNRDEELARSTGRLTLDTSTGLLWAVDHVAGGSWMGIEPRSGRFAILTNCRRSPAAPLRSNREAPESATCSDGERVTPAQCAEASIAPTAWRGSAPLSHILAHTTVVPVAPLSTSSSTMGPSTEGRYHAQDNEKQRWVTLAYNPQTSRGTVIKNFLQTGLLPGDAGASVGGDDGLASALPAVLRSSPYYGGFNLLSCDNLRQGSGVREDDAVNEAKMGNVQETSQGACTTAPTTLYTSNRYSAQHRCRVSPGTIHCLQNSYLDNMHGEPLLARLEQLFANSLHSVIDPIEAKKPPSSSSSSSNAGISPAEASEIATALADECLCDRCEFDIPTLEKTDDALRTQMHASNPLLGFTEEELHEHFGRTTAHEDDVAVRFCDGGAAAREAYLQSNIFKVPFHGHGTRVQSMVLVERVATEPPKCFDVAPPVSTTVDVIHFCQRDVSFDASTRRVVAAPWVVYHIASDGSCVCDSAATPDAP